MLLFHAFDEQNLHIQTTLDRFLFCCRYGKLSTSWTLTNRATDICFWVIYGRSSCYKGLANYNIQDSDFRTAAKTLLSIAFLTRYLANSHRVTKRYL